MVLVTGDRLKALVAILVMLLIFLTCASVYVLLPAYFEHQKTQADLADLDKSLEQQRREMRELQKEINALREDHRAIERVAREKFGLCREGEKIYHFDAPAGITPAPNR